MAPSVTAHRGLWWPDRSAENTLPAFDAAFRAGFGVEVDVRRVLDGPLILAHDKPQMFADLSGLALWEQFLELAWAAPSDLPILVNLKEPGTEADVAKSIQKAGLHPRCWLFDFELCGADPTVVKAHAPEVRCLARVSDRPDGEHGGDLDGRAAPHLPPWATGFWLDQWEVDWVDADAVDAWGALGPVFVAAPDLHGRPFDLGLVGGWAKAAGFCTDVPHLITALYDPERPELHPADPWW